MIRPKDSINTVYLNSFLNSNGAQLHIQEKTKGATLRQINMEDVRKIGDLLPPIALQNQFAEKVQAIEAQKAKMQEGLKAMEELFGSLMQRAFNGEIE